MSITTPNASRRFRAVLRAAIASGDVSISGLASSLETSRSSIQRLISGDQVPSLDRAERIAKALGKDLAEMIG